MIKYEVSINKLTPKHFNDARYSYEIKVLNDGVNSVEAGAFGCTMTLWGAKRKLQKELVRIDGVLTPHQTTKVIIAEGSIKDLERLL